VDHKASVLWIEATAEAGQQRQRFLVAARLDDGDGLKFFDVGGIGFVKQDGSAGLGKGRPGALVGLFLQRAVDDRKRALVVALEHRLRGRDALGGIGRQQRQAAERGLHGAAQAVVEANGRRIVRQLVNGGPGCGIDDLAVGLGNENLFGVGISRQPAVLQGVDDGKSQRIARDRDRTDRLVGVGKLVIGEFGDRVLERPRKRRYSERCDQQD
jgi:hypothetical protein